MKIYSVVMFCMAVGLLIAAGLLQKGETGWLRSFNWAAVKDKKKYAKFLGRVVAYMSFVTLVSALADYLSIGLAVVLLIVGFIAVLVYAVKKSKEHYR